MPLNPDTERPWEHLGAGHVLKRWREAKKLSQVAAAERLGIDPVKLNSFENGRGRPCLDVAAAIEQRTSGRVRAVTWAVPLPPEPRRRAA